MLKNLKFDTKDPSMWLNGVIILLIIVVFILLAVQVFTPRKDVIDGFHTIPISNRNLPWPFSDAKFDPLYYSLVFAGKTKNGSAHGTGRVLFSESFMPVNKDNLPLSIRGTRGFETESLTGLDIKNLYEAAQEKKNADADIVGNVGDAADADKITALQDSRPNADDINTDASIFRRGDNPGNSSRNADVYTKGITDENVLYHSANRPQDTKNRVPVKKVNGRDVVRVSKGVIRELLQLVEVTTEDGTKRGVVLFNNDGVTPGNRGVKGKLAEGGAEAVAQVPVGGDYISRNTFKKLLGMVKKLNITNDAIVALEGRAYGVDAAGATTDEQKGTDDTTLTNLKKIVSDLRAGANYQNYTVSERSADDKQQFELFSGEWKEGKLTKATIRDCGGGNFTIYYNDKEQIDDEDSVEVALQWLRTPMYASCIGA